MIYLTIAISFMSVVACVPTVFAFIAEGFFALCLSIAFVVSVPIMVIRKLWEDYNNSWVEYILEVDDSANFNEFVNKYSILRILGDNRYLVMLKDSNA